MRITERRLLALLLPVLALAAGCFMVSGQITFVHNFGDGVATADQEVNTFFVDLTDNDDYEEHKDKIKSVEAVGFEVTVENLTGSPATAEGYLTINDLGSPTVAQIQQQATRILSATGNPVDPNSTRVIDFEESQAYLENFDVMKDAVAQGTFYVYLVSAEGTEVDYDDLTLVVTINVEL